MNPCRNYLREERVMCFKEYCLGFHQITTSCSLLEPWQLQILPEMVSILVLPNYQTFSVLRFCFSITWSKLELVRNVGSICAYCSLNLAGLWNANSDCLHILCIQLSFRLERSWRVIMKSFFWVFCTSEINKLESHSHIHLIWEDMPFGLVILFWI